MADTSTNTAVVACISAGAVLISQVATLVFNYFNERRKQDFELSRSYTQKKIGIGESFFKMCGAYLSHLNDLVYLLENAPLREDEDSKKLIVDEFMEKANEFKIQSGDSGDYGSAELYYNVSRTYKSVLEETSTITKQVIRSFELQKKYYFGNAKGEQVSREAVLNEYKNTTGYVKNVIISVQNDMDTVKEEILRISFRD